MTDLRVGRISALNMFPVYHHLETAHLPGVSFTDGLPALLNAGVLSGRLDVSAMSSIEYARHAHDLALMPVGCIACEGAVDSIRLLCPVPPHRVTAVAVTPHSASSVTLLRVLLGPDVPFRVMASDAEAPAALARGEAVLLIADAALTAHRDRLAPYSVDLGEAWKQRTGLPMVFAVWAARRDVARTRPDALEALGHEITEARAAFLADPGAVATAAARRFPFDREFITGYLSRLRYAFGDAERAGLARFLEMARAAGELDDVPVREAAAA
jgi:chorismate dehydratase